MKLLENRRRTRHSSIGSFCDRYKEKTPTWWYVLKVGQWTSLHAKLAMFRISGLSQSYRDTARNPVQTFDETEPITWQLLVLVGCMPARPSEQRVHEPFEDENLRASVPKRHARARMHMWLQGFATVAPTCPPIWAAALN
jgi:hypothetical protein